LEAAVYGLPTIFGPHHTKAKEALDLIQQNGAIAVSSSNELKQAITYLQNEKECQLYSTVSKNYVERNTGATAQILKATNFGGLL
jgi:3-deoxy-D-manno-octulosonic-acid transferase